MFHIFTEHGFFLDGDPYAGIATILASHGFPYSTITKGRGYGPDQDGKPEDCLVVQVYRTPCIWSIAEVCLGTLWIQCFCTKFVIDQDATLFVRGSG